MGWEGRCMSERTLIGFKTLSFLQLKIIKWVCFEAVRLQPVAATKCNDTVNLQRWSELLPIWKVMQFPQAPFINAFDKVAVAGFLSTNVAKYLIRKYVFLSIFSFHVELGICLKECFLATGSIRSAMDNIRLLCGKTKPTACAATWNLPRWVSLNCSATVFLTAEANTSYTSHPSSAVTKQHDGIKAEGRKENMCGQKQKMHENKSTQAVQKHCAWLCSHNIPWTWTPSFRQSAVCEKSPKCLMRCWKFTVETLWFLLFFFFFVAPHDVPEKWLLKAGW